MIGDTDAQTLILGGKTLRADLREALTSATLTRTIEGAGTLELSLNDKDRALVRSKLFNERTAATIDKTVYELVQVRKSGSSVGVTFEDAVVADLRKQTKLLSAKAGTTTIDAFARRLIAAAPGAKLVAFPGQKNLAPLAVGGDEPEDYWSALVRFGEERGWRCIADRGTVYLGPDSWLAKRVSAVSIREHDGGIENIDWDSDAGKKATRATFTAAMARWSAAPGNPVNVVDQGLGSGLWLVEEISRPLFQTQGTVTLVRQQPALPEPKPEPRDDGQATGGASAVTSGALVAGPVSAKGFSWPLSGTLTSGYGQRSGRLHAGVDIACSIGTPVRCAKAGVVTFAGWATGYGNAIYVDHGGEITRYAHLSKIEVRSGQQIDLGARLGLSGNTGNSTGPHLHFEVRVGGRAVDPLSYLPSRR